MKGNVKFIEEVSWQAIEKNGIITKGEKKRIDYEHDSLKKFCNKGNLIEEIFYKSDGTTIYSNIKNYYENGNLVEEIFYRNNIKDNLITYKYDKIGKEIEKIMRNSDGGLIYKAFKNYFRNESMVESNVFLSEDTQSSKTIWLYDKNGNMIEMSNYDWEGMLEDKRISKYDNKGNCIEWTHYSSDGIMNSKYTSKYDNLNNEIEWNKIYDSDSNGEPRVRKTWKYEYDIEENWVKRIYLEDNIPKSIVERKIEYYKIENNSIVIN